jgi:S-formylglutathione hydrolase FrmB
MRILSIMLKTALLTLLAAAATALALPEGVTISKDEGTNIPGTVTYTVTAPQQKSANKVEVLTPDDMDATRAYAYVICLPVNTGTAPKFGHPLTEAMKHDLANRFDVIFVVPAYDVEPWFGDHPTDPAPRQQAYVTDALIPAIESVLPVRTDAAGRFLVGFSKSGLGALGLMLRHPDQFARVATFDSYMGQPTGEQFRTWGFAATYGTRDNFDKFDPMLLIDKAPDQFKGDDRRFVMLAGGPGYRLGVDNFVAKLKESNIAHTHIVLSNAGHHWQTGWLPVAVAALNPPASTEKK